VYWRAHNWWPVEVDTMGSSVSSLYVHSFPSSSKVSTIVLCVWQYVCTQFSYANCCDHPNLQAYREGPPQRADYTSVANAFPSCSKRQGRAARPLCSSIARSTPASVCTLSSFVQMCGLYMATEVCVQGEEGLTIRRVIGSDSTGQAGKLIVTVVA